MVDKPLGNKGKRSPKVVDISKVDSRMKTRAKAMFEIIKILRKHDYSVKDSKHIMIEISKLYKQFQDTKSTILFTKRDRMLIDAWIEQSLNRMIGKRYSTKKIIESFKELREFRKLLVNTKMSQAQIDQRMNEKMNLLLNHI